MIVTRLMLVPLLLLGAAVAACDPGPTVYLGSRRAGGVSTDAGAADSEAGAHEAGHEEEEEEGDEHADASACVVDCTDAGSPCAAALGACAKCMEDSDCADDFRCSERRCVPEH